MYLIADGEVEIKLRAAPVRLGVGHFFGEIAVLRQARLSATVIATQPARLPILRLICMISWIVSQSSRPVSKRLNAPNLDASWKQQQTTSPTRRLQVPSRQLT
jgi:CRP-like cAMP-binding protein